MTTTTVEEQVEQFRQIVIAARSNSTVGPSAEKCIKRLNVMFQEDPEQFSDEDVRFVNVLRGFLGVRLAAHVKPIVKYPRKAKRKGDTLEHCWRCETPVDERFVDICPTCDSKAYHWRVCPVCSACGCQRVKKVLI